MRFLKIYVAGPLSAPTAEGYMANMSRMIKVAIELREMGHYVFVPCLDVLMGIVAGDWDYEMFTGNNLPFVECCDAIYVIAPSPGTDKELKSAIEHGLMVFRSMGAVKMHERFA